MLAVVVQDSPPRRSGCRSEGAAHGPALDRGAATLAAAARPLEQRQAGKLPNRGELEREPLGGIVSPLEAPTAVGRDERECVDAGRGNALADELRGLGGEPPQPALLPRVDEPARRRVVP